MESRVEAALDFGGVPFTVDAGFDETIDRPDDMTALFTLECPNGTMAIENWTTPVDIPVDLPDGGGLAPALAALLDGQCVDPAKRYAFVGTIDVGSLGSGGRRVLKLDWLEEVRD